MSRNKMEKFFISGLLIDCFTGFNIEAFEFASNEICTRDDFEKLGIGYLVNEFLNIYKSHIMEHDADYLEHLERHWRESLPQNYEELI